MKDLATRAIVADQHFLTSAGIAEILQHYIGITHALCAADFSEACAALAAGPAVGIITLDLTLPGMGGLDGVRFLRAHYPSLRIVVVSETANTDIVLGALAAGVHGYILKDMTAAAMVDAFRDVLEGKIFVPTSVSDVPLVREDRRTSLAERQDLALTTRQREVVQQLRQGRSNKEIARALDISESTVKVHMSAAFRQLGVHNRVGVLAVLDGQLNGTVRATRSAWAVPRLAAARA